jgi:LysM repeat protein
VRRIVVIVVAVVAALGVAGPADAARSAKVAALQVALRANGLYAGDVDGISGPMTRSALLGFQRKHGIRATGKIGLATRCKLGKLGRPLLGQRHLARGRVGWDVTSLEFRLRRFGLPAGRVDGRFDAATTAALKRFQRARGLNADGIAGTRTFRALAGSGSTRTRTVRRTVTHTVRPGEGFSVIARRYGVSAARLAGANGLRLTSVIAPGQRLRIPGRTIAVRRTPKPRPVTLTHTVQPGEGFFAIAGRYRLPPVSLARANGLRLTSVLTPGQRLHIPGRSIRISKSKPAVTRPASSAGARHTVGAGESFFSIAQRYHVSPWRLARASGLSLMATIVPGQRLRLPKGAHLGSSGAPVGRASIAAAIDRWAVAYGVDPKLARALAWMESGFQQDVVSSAGAIGVMQLLPETWEWVDTLLLGERTPRTYEGNVRAGVRYLRWQLDQFGGDVKLALAGYYQGARAVRERGLFEDTKQYVSVILQLYGSV